MTAYVDQIQNVVAHSDCATLRVGDTLLNIDTDQTRVAVRLFELDSSSFVSCMLRMSRRDRVE